MTWQDRLKPGAYTGPDGTRIEFDFRDLKKKIPKKTKAHEFASSNDTYVRDNGIKGRRFPLRIYFSGDDHDIEADRFENLLVQRGAGRLEHPMYGRKLVTPFGEIGRDDLVTTAGNQTVFDVNFYSTIEALFPSDSVDTSAAVDVAIASTAFEDQFALSIDDGTPGEAANFASGVKAIANGMRSGLAKAEDGTAALQSKMDRVNDSINNTLANGVGTPLSLASQLKQMALAPSRSGALLKDRLAAYSDLASSIFSGKGTGAGAGTGSSESGEGVILPGVVVPGFDSTAANSFHTNSMAAASMVLGTASAVSAPVEGQEYKSKTDVVEQIENLQELYDDFIAWNDANFAALALASTAVDPVEPVASGQGSVDTGEAADALYQVIATTTSHLLSTAFVLPAERTFITSKTRTVVDLCAQLYGGVTPFLDDFIEANNFTGDQILQIPAGTKVVYYATG